jgi:tetratricopeptide (TPR) repeat protein
MRRSSAIAARLAQGVLCALPSLAGCGFDAQPPASPASEAPPAGRVPSWVPALSSAQTALLAPVKRAVKSPAARVFPDLERFGYANNRPLARDEDAIKFTRMVTQVLNDSPRFYVLGDLPAGAANPIVQYGPIPGEPDGLSIVAWSADGVGRLVPAPGAAEASGPLAQASDLVRQGKASVAADLLRAAVAHTPRVPALGAALGAALAAGGRAGDAELAYREAMAADPTFAPAHLGLAELADARGDRRAARHELAEALALDPSSLSSRRGAELLAKLGPAGEGAGRAAGGWYDAPAPKSAGDAPSATPSATGRGEPFPVFLDVDDAGAIHVASGAGDAAQIYGGCRAVMRHEPELRAQIFQQPRETPYYLSVAEEVVCLEAGVGAYLATGKGGKPERIDPDLEQLLRIAREDGLSGYVMFEILGRHRPERARTAPPDVHRDTVGYVERWVLARHEPAPEGVYNASR